MRPWQSRRARAVAMIGILAWVSWRLFRGCAGAPYEGLADSSWTEGTRVLARDGRLLGERPTPEGLRGHSMRIDEVSDRLILATIASEDRRWAHHDGVDRFALVRAFISYVRHGHVVSGGSTITQQLVKRLDHQGKPQPRSVAVKLHEMARAQNLEARYPLVGQWFQVNTPPNSVALASQHSGSLRWYGERQTLRWDLLEPDELIPTVRELEAHGAVVYAALEGTEQPAFDAKFSKELAQLSVDAMGRVRNVSFLRLKTISDPSGNR